MLEDIWSWLWNLVLTSGVLVGIAYLLRDTAAKFLFKFVEQRFEQQMETFKAEIRDNEKELDHIRSFLSSARRERDSALQVKRFEAAETLLRECHKLSQLSTLVEYMKILNGEQILKYGDDPKVIEFIEVITKPFDVDGKIKMLGSFDRTGARLYLSDKTLKAFDAYESIIMQATMMMKFYSLQLQDKAELVNPGTLSKKIVELVPASKEGFEKFGEKYAYHWTEYFHDEVLRLLRYEVSGLDDTSRDAKSAERVALESRQAQISVRLALRQSGLSETLLKPDERVAVSSVVEKGAL